jgi:hypothetical protein
MRFWDSSAIVSTFLDEPLSPVVRALLAEEPRPAVWWATPVECLGAIGRRERAGALAGEDVSRALASLAELEEAWVECPPSERVRAAARRIVRTHDVRTADAMQVAAATVLSDGEPASLPLVTLDERLALAARREGFPVLP